MNGREQDGFYRWIDVKIVQWSRVCAVVDQLNRIVSSLHIMNPFDIFYFLLRITVYSLF